MKSRSSSGSGPWPASSRFSNKCKWLIGAALMATMLLALAYVVRQSTHAMGANHLTAKESAYLRKWSRSAWESRPDFDVEYASIVAARAIAAKAQAILDIKNSKKSKQSSSSGLGLGLGIGALEVLQEDFHPIDDLLSLIKAARSGKHRGKNNANDIDRQNGSGSGSGNGETALLCASFSDTTASDLQRVLKNMKVMSHQCHWAVIVYSSGYIDATATAANSTATTGESKKGQLLADFRQSVVEMGIRMVMLQEVENQYTLLKRFASRTNPRGTDGQRAAGGDGTDALGRDALQHMSPAIYSQYIKFANPRTVADRTGLDEVVSSAKEKTEDASGSGSGTTASSSASVTTGAGIASRGNITESSVSDSARTSELANKAAGRVRGSTAGPTSTEAQDVWDAEKAEGDMLRPERGDIPHYNNRANPKLFHWTYLLSLLSSYKRVWMLDSSSISLDGFHVDKFFRIIECAFEEPPIIAHPLISSEGHGASPSFGSFPSSSSSSSSSSSYKYLHETYWHQERTAGTVDAAATSFVNTHAPLLDSKFLEWYITRLVLPMLAPAHYLGADWGFEGLLCNAAAMFRSLTKPRTSESTVRGGTESGKAFGIDGLMRNGAKVTNKVDTGATATKRRQLLQKDSLSPVCVVTVGADPVKSVRAHERDADIAAAGPGPGAGAGAGAGAGVGAGISVSKEKYGKRLREHLNQEMLAMIREVMPDLYSSGQGNDNDPKANGYASARLDAVLSKNLQCK